MNKNQINIANKIVFTICIFVLGVSVGCIITGELNKNKISQLETRNTHLETTLDTQEHDYWKQVTLTLEQDYWRQVTLSEYLAMKTFEFKTEAVSGGKGEISFN